VKWTGGKYELPGGGPGPITRAYWWIEDRWLALDPIDRRTILIIVIVVLALVLFEVFDSSVTKPY